MKFDDLTPTNTPIVVVEWADPTSYDNWNEASDDLDEAVVSSVGWLLQEDDKAIIFAGSYEWMDGQWSDIHVLPVSGPKVRLRQRGAEGGSEDAVPGGHGGSTDTETEEGK